MEENFDFENRIVTTDITEEKINKISIKDLGFPEIVEKKLIGCVNYTRTASASANILLVGCPQRHIPRILEAISNDAGVNSKLVEDTYLKQGDIAAILTNLAEGDFACFTHIEALNSEILLILKQAISMSKLNITLGKGAAARNISIDLPTFSMVITVDNISQVPKEMIESFYEIIDFKKYDYDLRVMFINDFAKNHYLNFCEEVKERLAKQFTQYDQLKIQLIEIRNKAYEAKVTEITESFLLGNLESLPELEKIDGMDGRTFELFTGDLLRANGFENISVTKASYDYGVDVIAEKDDIKYAIQCKRYNGPIGVSAVQEVIASKSLHDCHVACVLTNSTYTPAAIELAKKNLVILWDRKKLQQFIDKANT